MNLTKFSVKNYAFTLVLFTMVTILGVVTILTMPRAEDPQINPPTFPVVVVYPGTSPQDMEELVVKPIENKLYELENIDKINTTIEDGIAIIRVEFKYGVDVDNKYQEVIREVNVLRADLPSDILSIDIRKVDPSDVNILQVALISENASLAELKDQAERLKAELERVIDLKKVKISGAASEEIRIDLKLDRLAEYNIPLDMVLGSIQSDAVNIPGGSLTTSTKTFNVKTSGKYNNLEEIAQTVIYNSNGTILYLRDVADIGFRYENDRHITRLNGYRCVLIHAAQKTKSNISASQQKYDPILLEFERSLPSNIKIIKHFDQADNVSLRLSGLGVDFLIAIFLVLLTLAPLGLRASIVVMIAIPLSLALGLVGLNAFGISLNQLSIVGLVVSLGLLVDDSIVVVENIERWLREGFSKKEAAIKATKQITLAVIGCTATLIIAFLPLVFLPGAPGEFVRGLPLAVITSISASMIVSLTVVPFLASRFLKEHHNPEGNFFLRVLKKVIGATYSKVIKIALSRPMMTMLIALALFIGSLAIFPKIGFKLFPTSEKPIFLIDIKMPLQTSIQESNRIAQIVEKSLKEYPAIQFFTTNIGKGNPQIYYNVAQQEEKYDFAQIFVQLDKKAKPKVKKELIRTLQQEFEMFPFARIEVKDFEQGPPLEAPISIRIVGDHLDTLRSLAFQVENLLRTNDGTIYVNNELNTLKTDIKINIDKQKARTLGLFTADIDRTIRLAVAGLKLGTLTDEKGDEFDIKVNTPRSQWASLSTLDPIFINNRSGAPIPLHQVATIDFETSPTNINHINKRRFVKITASTRPGVLANDVLKDIVPQLDKLNFPVGYNYTLGGEAESEGDAFSGGFLNVIIFTIFLFVAVLILQFKTFRGILIVLSVIPLGIIGGVSMLWLSGNPMSFIAIIGFIGLAGIEVKNSILLVDFTNQLRQEGMALDKAIEQAGELRFLPVVLTSLTAIGGLLPLAISTNPLISPLAFVLIGGLITSTLLSRVVTPVMYKLIPPKIALTQEP